MVSLRRFTLFEETCTKYTSNYDGDNEPSEIILWVPPVRTMLFPQTSFKLYEKRLCVLCFKKEILGPNCGWTKLSY